MTLQSKTMPLQSKARESKQVPAECKAAAGHTLASQVLCAILGAPSTILPTEPSMQVRFSVALIAAVTVTFFSPSALLIAQEKPAAESSQSTKVTLEAVPTAEEKKSKKAGPRILPTTKAFIATMNDEQKEKAILDFDTEKRVQWHFIPKETRKGFPVMEMSEEQKVAAHKVLQACLSKTGFAKTKKIMELESVLLKLEGPGSAGRRNPEKYYFTIFGKPKPKAAWGLSIEGHHLSLNFTFEGSKITDSTPQFFAANPATLKDDFGEGLEKGFRVLRAEEQIGFAIVKSLDEEQLKKAMLPGETPKEIRAAGEAQPPKEELPGLAVSDMNEEQVTKLKALLKAYTSKMKPLVSKERWTQIEEAGFEKVKFSWSGAKRPGVGHYYVVQGPTFLVEFINVQPDAAGNPANHIHCVWRDTDGDFGLPASN